MANTKRRPRADREDPYERITNAIIAQLEAGTAPWKKPWQSTGGLLPRNMDTNKIYQGANLLLLDMSAMASGFTSPFWGTYKQIEALGGNVRKGEHGTTIRKWVIIEDDKPREVGQEASRRGFVKFYTVFSYHQSEGLPKERFEIQPREALPEQERTVRAEEVIDEYLKNGGPSLRHGTDRAYYSPKLDMISVPNLEDFETPGDYYATVFHEITHSTGHAKRLDRHGIEGGHQFSSEPYAREELIAEMGSAFATSILDIEPEANLGHSAEYLNSWIGRLRNDKTLIFEAATAAQKAVEHIGISLEQEIILAHEQELTTELGHIVVTDSLTEQPELVPRDVVGGEQSEPTKSLATLRRELDTKERERSISAARRDSPEDLARCDLDIERHRLTWRRTSAVHYGAADLVAEIDDKRVTLDLDYKVVTGEDPNPVRREELIKASQERHSEDAERFTEAANALDTYREELRQTLGEKNEAWIENLGPIWSEDVLLEIVEHRRNFGISDSARPFGDPESETHQQALQRTRIEQQLSASRVDVGLYQSR